MRLEKIGDVYYARFKVGGRWVRKTTNCTDRRAAEAKGAELERAAADPAYAARKAATLEDAVKLLLADRAARARAGKRSEATVEFYSRKAGHLLRVLEHSGDVANPRASLSLLDLDAGAVDGYIDTRRAEGASESTIQKEIVTLRASLKLAKRRGWFAADLDEVLPSGFGPEYKPRERYLPPEELAALLAQLEPDRAARVAFMVATSAEWGATERALRGDFSGDAVHVRGTKRSTRDRKVPMVAAWQRSLLAYALAHAGGEDKPGAPLFISWGNVRRDLHAACARAKIEPCSPNDLRRTCARWLRQQGVAVDLVSLVLGHRDTRMVERVYGRLSEEDLAARLGLYLGAPGGGEGVKKKKASQGESAISRPNSAQPKRPGAANTLPANLPLPGSGKEKSPENRAFKRDSRGFSEVPRDGVEPPTRGFSVPELKLVSVRKKKETGGTVRGRQPLVSQAPRLTGKREV
jgi:integrase